MANAALSLPECDAGCGRVATRGNYCPACAVACEDCGFFWSAADLVERVCPDCVRLASKEADNDGYHGCHCGEGCDK